MNSICQEERAVWLNYHKRKWELQAKERQDRKRRRIDFGDAPTGSSFTGSSRGIGGFLRRTARSIMDMPWQIVQVQCTLNPYTSLEVQYFVGNCSVD